MTTVALIVAAGSGSRSGSAAPKQYAPIAGRPMVAWSHAALSAHPAIDRVIVVVGVGQQDMIAAAVPGAEWVIGGAERRDSVRAGLDVTAGATRVLVHDAARPFVPHAVIDRLLAALDDAPGAIPVLPVADTLVAADGATVARETLARVQTPQAFDAATLARAHATWEGGSATDDAQMVRALGLSVAQVEGDMMLDKITYPADFAAAAARVGVETRSASGFDVHRLEDGEELWLGGVLIPHHQGLSGHSDADVALHAITDAVLGAIAAGDIGTHFPPSDPRWRGAESGQFLAHARSLVEARGGRITFVDLTLMCEAPKIGPHRAAMQARIAELLGLPTDRVSVKATTTERLGFTGRGEGIAAQAVATVTLPAGLDA
ncbi:bifunctional 2-C-methyl-D-erythritol 4-phosphate cytidylyltransferase/2-C-methyl-D-erythritol 2,4-cyclodiphosphate synthase [Sphingomonas yunnanensis]|uniref:bifunctional 2-C-methyl-D-erythritol 4-phosphate cytidylyltransferase/2-C-methyl-D-erythritol 2,4-cyclodiphosphate synthase n=1 Tax=Sphingomonas yunnanensis TaxID=310400 RepID=UPI001CA65ECF|nr:bifunctional 2-C-methyl-D-erythritol 4-phosphate cytidylyltransferase/2-C-methyl-D-erythritol 2,4-cyclodiphosphate synthase [Sphingomonas yunnanensis]MBY9061911.1 bifunctional 2-C-methyl-D-erythritol 4-phosphate cytidylyltransferase/2-C-methyl-D-erythritol 2,4-cyclodiphosphate synthase [Sphingomonas yunnanensis]